MAVTKKPWGYLMTAANDTVTLDTNIYVKYVAFETANASADGTFDLRDASSGVNICPLHKFVDASETPPAQFAIENFVGLTLWLQGLPTAGRVFIATGRRP